MVGNLEALKMAVEINCPELEFVENTSHYRTWKDTHGKLVGDWPAPPNMTKDEWNKIAGENATHIIRTKKEFRGHDEYEIGLVPMRVTRDPETGAVLKDEQGRLMANYDPENPNEYSLACDFWGQGNGILRRKGVGQKKDTPVKDPKTGKMSSKPRAYDDLYKAYQQSLTKLTSDAVGDTTFFLKTEDGVEYSETYKPWEEIPEHLKVRA
jgi:hypothetical protein